QAIRALAGVVANIIKADAAKAAVLIPMISAIIGADAGSAAILAPAIASILAKVDVATLKALVPVISVLAASDPKVAMVLANAIAGILPKADAALVTALAPVINILAAADPKVAMVLTNAIVTILSKADAALAAALAPVITVLVSVDPKAVMVFANAIVSILSKADAALAAALAPVVGALVTADKNTIGMLAGAISKMSNIDAAGAILAAIGKTSPETSSMLILAIHAKTPDLVIGIITAMSKVSPKVAVAVIMVLNTKAPSVAIAAAEAVLAAASATVGTHQFEALRVIVGEKASAGLSAEMKKLEASAIALAAAGSTEIMYGHDSKGVRNVSKIMTEYVKAVQAGVKFSEKAEMAFMVLSMGIKGQYVGELSAAFAAGDFAAVKLYEVKAMAMLLANSSEAPAVIANLRALAANPERVMSMTGIWNDLAASPAGQKLGLGKMSVETALSKMVASNLGLASDKDFAAFMKDRVTLVTGWKADSKSFESVVDGMVKLGIAEVPKRVTAAARLAGDQEPVKKGKVEPGAAEKAEKAEKAQNEKDKKAQAVYMMFMSGMGLSGEGKAGEKKYDAAYMADRATLATGLVSDKKSYDTITNFMVEKGKIASKALAGFALLMGNFALSGEAGKKTFNAAFLKDRAAMTLDKKFAKNVETAAAFYDKKGWGGKAQMILLLLTYGKDCAVKISEEKRDAKGNVISGGLELTFAAGKGPAFQASDKMKASGALASGEVSLRVLAPGVFATTKDVEWTVGGKQAYKLMSGAQIVTRMDGSFSIAAGSLQIFKGNKWEVAEPSEGRSVIGVEQSSAGAGESPVAKTNYVQVSREGGKTYMGVGRSAESMTVVIKDDAASLQAGTLVDVEQGAKESFMLGSKEITGSGSFVITNKLNDKGITEVFSFAEYDAKINEKISNIFNGETGEGGVHTTFQEAKFQEMKAALAKGDICLAEKKMDLIGKEATAQRIMSASGDEKKAIIDMATEKATNMRKEAAELRKNGDAAGAAKLEIRANILMNGVSMITAENRGMWFDFSAKKDEGQTGMLALSMDASPELTNLFNAYSAASGFLGSVQLHGEGEALEEVMGAAGLSVGLSGIAAVKALTKAIMNDNGLATLVQKKTTEITNKYEDHVEIQADGTKKVVEGTKYTEAYGAGGYEGTVNWLWAKHSSKVIAVGVMILAVAVTILSAGTCAAAGASLAVLAGKMLIVGGISAGVSAGAYVGLQVWNNYTSGSVALFKNVSLKGIASAAGEGFLTGAAFAGVLSALGSAGSLENIASKLGNMSTRAQTLWAAGGGGALYAGAGAVKYIFDCAYGTKQFSGLDMLRGAFGDFIKGAALGMAVLYGLRAGGFSSASAGAGKFVSLSAGAYARIAGVGALWGSAGYLAGDAVAGRIHSVGDAMKSALAGAVVGAMAGYAGSPSGLGKLAGAQTQAKAMMATNGALARELVGGALRWGAVVSPMFNIANAVINSILNYIGDLMSGQDLHGFHFTEGDMVTTFIT
ncbi:MAG: hypothetical protein WC369_07750, partial [Dehalococcoidales bacterium]